MLIWPTVHSQKNERLAFCSKKLNYCSNQKIFMQHIRLIHKFLSPKNIWPISADRPNFLIFRFFFFFFPRNFGILAFFSEIFFWDKILNIKKVSENHKKNFGEQHNIKELSRKKIWVYTQKARKNLIFLIFRFFQFRVFSLKKSAFPRIIFFIFPKTKIQYFFEVFFSEQNNYLIVFLIFFFDFVSSFIF